MKKLVIALSLAVGACAEHRAGHPGSRVKITPLGSHDGEFCPFDRALVFEDPDGTRILYDAGRTVRGPTTRASARSTRCCSPTCTATISAT